MNKFKDIGYIPFNLNSINKNLTFDSILILDNGSYFLGRSFGAKKECLGEICFNTSISGYQEIITDPSYTGQIITFTFPHIGNIGSNKFDEEGSTNSVAGIVVRQHPTNESNWRSEISFNEWLIKNNIPGISGIDTRLLTKIIRKYKSCNAMIFHEESGNFKIEELRNKLKKHPKMDGLNLSSSITTKKQYQYTGVKQNILRHLVNLNAEVRVFSENASIEDINNFKPDGIFLSNGPGDPSATEIKCRKLLSALFQLKIPVFGICIGHQLIGLSFGAKTNKMPQGHRGANHPVKNLSKNKVEITSQNHGYQIDLDSLPNCLEVTHTSLFDNSIEGIKHRSLPIFSVQFHPEASPGPTESSYLFNEFLKLIKETKNAKA